jgi:hypothetical protein
LTAARPRPWTWPTKASVSAPVSRFYGFLGPNGAGDAVDRDEIAERFAKTGRREGERHGKDGKGRGHHHS